MKVGAWVVAIVGLSAIAAFGQASAAGQPAQSQEQAAQPPSEGPRTVWDGVYTEEQAKRGEEVYKTTCTVCHGENLAGSGPATPLTGPVFSANWNGLSLGDLLERIRTTMPLDKPGTLARPKVADVLAFLLSANKFPAGKVELARQTEMLKEIKFLSIKP